MFSCEGEEETIREKQNELLSLNVEIKELIKNKSCNGEGDCASIAFGSKACGGPQEFLVYAPSTVSVPELRQLVKEYNGLEKELNLLTNAVSTCDIITAPQLFCEDQVCVGR